MKKALYIFLLFCFGCAGKKDDIMVTVKPITSGSLQINGLPADMLYQLNRDTITERWYTLMPVFKMPADADLIDDQPEQPGTYKVAGNTILFTPDTAFVKGQQYFLRFYHIEKGNSVWDLIGKNKVRPGTHTHTDVIFTP
ncbi:MAG: hypothetical protein EOP46_11555 [Sphingobacteriaceae bacterium]|nr:MAG: hypothetical protein EOP46_11555 [Sphingobacteriaceae bacterium]